MKARARLKQFKKPSKKVMALIVAAAVLLTGGIVIAKKRSAKKASGNQAVSLDTVDRGDIDVIISGSAAVEPKERYEIISMVSGDIISSPYEEGDHVEKGDLLYQFDTDSIDLSMQKQQLSMQQSALNYNQAQRQSEDLKITAPCSGVLSGITAKKGEEVQQGQEIAKVSNSVVLRVVLPFNESQISSIYTGAAARVTSSANMGGVNGKVVDKATVATPQSDGSKLYDVTVEFANPGAFVEGQVVGGEINGMISPGSGKIQYSENGSAKSNAAGTIEKIYYGNGDYVKRGQTIMTISSDTVSDNIKNSSISYENAKLSMEEAQKQLENYSITAPISGTVITKNSKAGDTIDKTNSTQVLMVVADISTLKFSLQIDELDVSKVEVGQEVEITSDALPDETFRGQISNVSVEGTATNGVTTYTAEVLIPEPGNLRPSMNVDASVIVESAENVLRVPASDVTTIMGDSYVYVPEDSELGKKAKQEEKTREKSQKKEKPSGTPDTTGEKPEGAPDMSGEKPDGAPDSSDATPPDMTNDQAKNASSGAPGGATPPAPEGFVSVKVTVGISSDDYTEIVSGLSEGDEVYSQTVTSDDSDSFMMPGGGMGGAPGGGMGGAPGGGGMGGGPGGGGGPRG